ncbi:hypothetical protein ACP70R_015921 [Stipagrostis hirtigluma subsp. patula]
MRFPKRRRRRRAPKPASGGSADSIPDDILFSQILVLLPVKCLMRLRTVCRLWRDTIASDFSVHQHLELSKTSSRSSMVIVPRKYQRNHLKVGVRFLNIYSFQPERSNVAELMLQKQFPNGIPVWSMPLHCDGLILIPCLAGEIFVCNPATKEFVELPQGSCNITSEQRVALGFDPWSGNYKVAKHFIRSYDEAIVDGVRTVIGYNAGHEILTLGDGSKETWKWRATMDPPYPIKARTPICLPGFFYWSAVESVADSGHGHGKVSISDVILRFSLRDETFTVHPNPPCRSFVSTSDVLCELGGKLCYLHSASPLDVAIWLAEDGPNLTWSLRCRVDILPIPRHHRVFACSSTDQDKIYLSVDACDLFKCNPRDGSLEAIINMRHGLMYDHGNGVKFSTGTLPISHYMVPFVESLVRIRPWL